MSEENTAGKLYCPYCLTYYRAGEYHQCQPDSISTNWKYCSKCNTYYMTEYGHHVCYFDEILYNKLDNIEQLLKQVIELLNNI